MLESNTEAKQATGTGSKLGVGVGQEGKGGAELPSGTRGRLGDLALSTAGETCSGVSACIPGN